jgi:copper chaperone NosL
MRPLARLLLAVAVVALGLLYVLPLWQIRLEAPQYPEGVVMYIWLTKLSGQIDLINGLNHYIGMRPIRQADFPEFGIMPWLIAGLIVLGLVAVALNRRGFVGLWIALFAAIVLVGLADFYRWGYEYGHNLDPHAPIKVPGMAYQPPLIGSKKLLNFTAYSYPAAGGMVAFGSLLLSAAVWTAECIAARKRNLSCMEWKLLQGVAPGP